MRVLAIEYFPTTERGGSEKAYYEILKRLRKQGHIIILAYCCYGNLVPQYEADGIQTIKIKRTNIQNYFSFKEWKEFWRSYTLLRGKFDVIYLNYINDTPIALLCKFFDKKRIVCHVRIPYLSNCRQFKFSGQFVDEFIFLNKNQSLPYKKQYRRNKASIISDGLEIETVPCNESGGYGAAYLGRISPEKGLIELLDTWKLLRDKYQLHIPLSITGPSYSSIEKEYKNTLQEIIIQYKLCDIVKLDPPVDAPIQYIQSFSFSVFPSVVEETFGRTIVESILAGRPVFARNVGVAKEILAPEEENLIFLSSEELAEKIYKYISGEIKIEINVLLKHVKKNYDIEKQILSLEKILQLNSADVH